MPWWVDVYVPFRWLDAIEVDQVDGEEVSIRAIVGGDDKPSISTYLSYCFQTWEVLSHCKLDLFEMYCHHQLFCSLPVIDIVLCISTVPLFSPLSAYIQITKFESFIFQTIGNSHLFMQQALLGRKADILCLTFCCPSACAAEIPKP